ncbi:nucleoside-triphosphatase [Streptomyces hiroshimensis]|uniref:Nucleoside-triphosphatase THEP1 n=1 Tax=Streptomyces hiroshimensis TaxID=66424 RepID=A0ABQ2Y831_9ACTN|nr:nucleoside-triphosphatase [Streptomyces hiroshimensis]GGX74029.1 nucleoside-triphosphatase THEP1 [Streptomyces hiroshimensis]
MPTRILLEGRPGVGKTTALRRLASLLHTRAPVGFTTEEIREGTARVGFALETLDGRRAVLAHVAFPGPPSVGRYGVDLRVMDELALSALAPLSPSPTPGALALIDELGGMELYSSAFRKAVGELLTADVDVVATVHARHDPFTDALKRRAGIELVEVTARNRDALPGELAARLGA